MIENIYALYDKNAKITLKPLMIERNDVVPVRQLTDLVNNQETLIHKHAGDFALVHIGEIDTETLEIARVTQRTVAEAADLKAE